MSAFKETYNYLSVYLKIIKSALGTELTQKQYDELEKTVMDFLKDIKGRVKK